jgi:hypothetical protein
MGWRDGNVLLQVNYQVRRQFTMPGVELPMDAFQLSRQLARALFKVPLRVDGAENVAEYHGQLAEVFES